MLKRKLILIAAILGLSFSLAGFCFASPLSLIAPGNGEGDVPVDGYFQWSQGPAGTVKYVLDIDQFTQSEDNILPTVCSGGVCSFAFLDLSVGNINYLSSYTWRITAYNAESIPIDSSSDYTFSTEQAPAPPPNGGNGGNGGGIPIGIINPLDADTLGEAINNLLNFLFFLGMAIGPILIIYAAFLLLTAAGDAAKVNRAKTIIFWTLIALAIILLAKGLPSALKEMFSS
jgi:hypothetical protein